MIIIGYILAVIMGITLGMIGAGGSILTMPILVYFLNVDTVTATGYSLLIVGLTALLGAAKYYIRNQINLTITLLFSIPSVAAVYLTRRFLVPIIPQEIFITETIMIPKDSFIMMLFASLMLLSSAMMIINKQPVATRTETSKTKLVLLVGLEGLLVGVITGLVGAGGGFLIIPALVLLLGLEMKVAIGSSLLIIALKSLIGFIGDLQTGIDVELNLLVPFILCSILGLIIGTKISAHYSPEKLKKIFGIFTLVLAIAVIIKEL